MPTNDSLDDLIDYIAAGEGVVRHWSSTSLTVNLNGLSGEMLASARLALDTWEAMTGFQFTEVTSGGNIKFDTNSFGAVTNSSFFSDGTMVSATISVSQSWMNGFPPGERWDAGTYGLQTYIHEIGHALGLNHGGPYNGSGDYDTDAIFVKDTWQYASMSYFDQTNLGDASYLFLTTPMLADIAAIRQNYGPLDANLGDTSFGRSGVYDFSLDAAFTIADDGGLDVIDLRGTTDGARLDLRAGEFSDVNGYVKNLAIAMETTIENAIGTQAGDDFTGNALANLLRGLGGADAIVGGTGDDTIVGGAGADELNGGAGRDRFIYATPKDISGDVVFDFVQGQDKISLKAIDADGLAGGDQAFDFIGSSSFGHVAGELRYVTSGSGTFIRGDLDGDGAADFSLRLATSLTLQDADFVL